MKRSMLWDINPCSPLKFNWHFGDNKFLLNAIDFQRIHGVVSQKTEFFIITVLKTASLTKIKSYSFNAEHMLENESDKYTWHIILWVTQSEAVFISHWHIWIEHSRNVLDILSVYQAHQLIDKVSASNSRSIFLQSRHPKSPCSSLRLLAIMQWFLLK
jgi:hypothetical protein